MKTQKRRRKENRTDYKKRLNLLKSKTPRVIVRVTNKYVISQYATSDRTIDKIEINTNSRELLKYGWPEDSKGGLKSIPAAYLTGLLMGKRILKNKKATPIVDLGVVRVIWGTRIFSFIKGLVDSGVKISHEEKTFPGEDRITGKHLGKDFTDNFNKIKGKIENE